MSILVTGDQAPVNPYARSKLICEQVIESACDLTAGFRAQRALGWRASHDVRSMLRDAWRFEQMNPRGLASVPIKGGADREGMT